MIVMPANSGKYLIHYWQGKYGGLGHLYSIKDRRGPFEHLPYAMDNGRFPCWANDIVWDEDEYLEFLGYYQGKGAMWSLVPDTVGDPYKTIEMWDTWAPKLFDMGFTLAFAVQDGMTERSVPSEAKVIFVGGSTDWKWDTAPMWAAKFPRVHIGRVNTYGKLVRCAKLGVESVDGTGFMRAPDRYDELKQFLVEHSDGKHQQKEGVHMAQIRMAFEGHE